MDRSDERRSQEGPWGRSPREPHRIDRYELLEELARGASGVVYRARDAQLGREVALKVLLGSHEDDARQRERFRREGESLAKVRHPHVVAVHAVGEASGRPYLVLDLVDGRSLQDRIDQDGPLPPREATALIATLARALDHLHAQGLLHRDLKPANVLLRAEDGAPLLTDFGLVRDEASDRSRLSRTGQMLGTPGFWAPEQARGDVNLLGPPTDVYGLGAVYFACLTGEPPIDGASLIHILAATQQAEIPPPSTLCSAVEPAMDRVCLHALSRQAEDRYPTAAAFAQDLERILEGGRVRARRRARSWSVGGGVAVLLVLALGVALGVWRAWIVPTRVADRVEKAQALVDRTRVTEAEPLLLEALELDPDNVVAWTLKAQCERSFGKVEAAKASVARALALDPTHSAALIERAQLAIRERDLAGALRDYDAVLVNDPKHLRALYGRAHLRRGAKDLKGSTADLARALALDPERPAGRLSSYAGQLLELGRHAEAHAAITQAVERFGPAPVEGERQLANQAYMRRAAIRMKLEDVGGAEADYETATRLVPNDISAWFRLGERRYARGDLPAAIRAFDRSLDVNPRYPPPRVVRARALDRLGRYREALADYDKLLKGPLTPADVITIRYRRGKTRRRLLDFRGAARDFTTILKLDPKHLGALTHRAEAYVGSSQFPSAVRDLDRAIGLLPADHPDRERFQRRRTAINEMVRRNPLSR